MQVPHHTNLCNTLPYLDNFTEDAVHLEGMKQEQSKHIAPYRRYQIYSSCSNEKTKTDPPSLSAEDRAIT
jgi:hypothetical protein